MNRFTTSVKDRKTKYNYTTMCIVDIMFPEIHNATHMAIGHIIAIQFLVGIFFTCIALKIMNHEILIA